MEQPEYEEEKIVDMLTICQAHPTSEVTYYCETCKRALCSACFPSHSSHILFNLMAMAKTISEQLAVVDNIDVTYKDIRSQYIKLEGVLSEITTRLQKQAEEITEYVTKEIQGWLSEYIKPSNQVALDLKKKRAEIESLIQAIETVISEKSKIQLEIQDAITNKQYYKVYQHKKIIFSAFISEAQLATVKEKAASLEKKIETDLVDNINVGTIKASLNKVIEKAKQAEWSNAMTNSAIFNISPKAARVEVIDVIRNKKLAVNLGLNIEGYDALIQGSNLYIIGGMEPGNVYLKTCLAFNLLESESPPMLKKADMTNERVAHTLQEVCKKYIYCIGGYNPTLKYLKQCEKYAIHLNRWTSVPSMNEHKAQVAVCLLNERFLYLFGGNIGPSKWLKSIEGLDLNREHDGWKIIKYTNPDDKWTGSYCSGCVAISDTEIIVFGGMQQEKRKNCYSFDRITIQELPNTLETEASFYQRKPKFFHGSIYAPSSFNDLHVCKNIPECIWTKHKISDSL